MARKLCRCWKAVWSAWNSGSELRERWPCSNSMRDLGDGGALLAWVDHELESARRFAKKGTDGRAWSS